ncbi:MAG: hypothetical protein KBS77_06910 [Bacteroidales bacterium]|nr:hypothetical protein [Candidatus Colicola faecequi]
MANKISKTDEWWAGLTIDQKERIAKKAAKDYGQQLEVAYPACSRWWVTLPEEKKQAIHDHCTDRHGYLMPEFKEGKELSY